MDSDCFDFFTRVIASTAPRRTLLGRSSALGVIPFFGEVKKRRKKKKKCKGCSICQRCRKGKREAKPDGTDCGGGATCQAGACTFPAVQKLCAGSCIPEGQCCPSDCDDGNTCMTGVCDASTCVYTPQADNCARGDSTGALSRPRELSPADA